MWTVGDPVTIMKGGSQTGNTAVVTIPDWNGQFKPSLCSKVTCSFVGRVVVRLDKNYDGQERSYMAQDIQLRNGAHAAFKRWRMCKFKKMHRHIGGMADVTYEVTRKIKAQKLIGQLGPGADTNGDDKLDKDDILASFYKNDSKNFKSLFENADADGNGLLDRDELLTFFEAIGKDAAQSKQLLETLNVTNDRDLDCDGFCKW